jgi:hypothetical protein
MDFGTGARSHVWSRERFQIEERGSATNVSDVDLMKSIVFLVARLFKESSWDLGFLYFWPGYSFLCFIICGRR